YIHRLRHARAPILAQTLQALFSGGGIPPRVTGSGSQTLTQQLQQLQQQAQQQVLRAPQIVVSGGQVVGSIGTTIVPDDATNSLLVRATPGDWLVMQQAIQALDLRPLQVVIEVIIAEVRRTEDLNLGVSISADASRNGRTTIGDLPNPPREQDFSLRIIRSGDIDVAATLSALAASGNVRVLSRPIVLAQNNQEASIAVGQERPFVQVQRGNVPGQQFSEDIVQYREVATTLTILPTINDDGYVNLAVTQEVNTATNEIQFGAPVISTRNAQTQILARNGQTVVLGGLIERQQDRTRGGIPFLKDIPLLGALFGNTRNTEVDAELFLFLTPHIVSEDEDADRLKQELENNAELLRPLTPIRPLIPPGTTGTTGRTPPPADTTRTPPPPPALP
ncbi:MAG TPA: secretin N-terminal domain-containing protein, partial [Longimicrobiales bacterium]|nr:secretin N-terminal domain-containing protein [Longimicrobiales bacterium]